MGGTFNDNAFSVFLDNWKLDDVGDGDHHRKNLVLQFQAIRLKLSIYPVRFSIMMEIMLDS